MGKLIDADALIHGLRVDPAECPGCPEPEFLDDIISLLEEAPAVDAVPVVRGRWSGDFCSKCGISKYNFIRILHDDDGPFGTWNFCPHCGADMRKDGNA